MDLSFGNIPIGIVTRNRAGYLDCTLRSLSATDLPRSARVIVFDDASDDLATRTYLETAGEIAVTRNWPRSAPWTALGLDFLPEDARVRGIADRVEVQRIAESSIGVVNASCAAITKLFEISPSAPGVILLQDDVVFNANWHTRLCRAAKQASRQLPLGILAGMHFDRNLTSQVLVTPAWEMRYYTAQCYFVMRNLFQTSRDWIGTAEHPRRGFDRRICYMSQSCGLQVRLLRPFVCQHIGVESNVREGRQFFGSATELGRFGADSHPPYAFAPEVRNFRKGLES